jgi:regulator of RNase E activity RraB
VDLSESRTIDCHFWSASEADAEALGIALSFRGFMITVKQRASNLDAALPWNLEVRIKQSVDLTVRPEFTEDLVTLADAHNSRYDGWGTSIERD